ncbi:MAG TPA: ATP-binding protein [Sumerlaeia bacterium]|nr:ATP-binding protein [Sumerlaeia bacterium]
MHREQVNRRLALLTLVVLVAVVGVLVAVERRDRGLLTDAIDATVGIFTANDALPSPNDLRPNFPLIEGLAQRAEDASPLIDRVFVSKRLAVPGRPDGTVLLHPYYYALCNPRWSDELKNLEQRDIWRGGERAGALYFELDRGSLVMVRAAIAVTVVLIVLTSAALVGRLFTQERALTATTQILEENQRELIRLERLSLAGLLTANIFHDIRKPVTNIKHELAELSEALGGFAGATRALKGMNDQVVLFFDILRDLNIERFVRSDEADEEYVDVNRVVEQALRLVQYERGSTQLNVALTPELPLILAHPYRLIQVFSNIILNAYQELEGRGELRIATRPFFGDPAAPPAQTGPAPSRPPSGGGASSSENVEAERTPPHVLIEISDNGRGIPAEAIGRIFSPFYSTKPPEKGTGLGLYISRTIVEEIGGALHVKSAPDPGTTFMIVLPAAD